jgi:hypothetical protein
MSVDFVIAAIITVCRHLDADPARRPGRAGGRKSGVLNLGVEGMMLIGALRASR